MDKILAAGYHRTLIRAHPVAALTDRRRAQGFARRSTRKNTSTSAWLASIQKVRPFVDIDDENEMAVAARERFEEDGYRVLIELESRPSQPHSASRF